MAKKLINLTLEELQSEMSIAGNPLKIAALVQKMKEISNEVNNGNVSEVQSFGLGLRWLIARLNHQIKYLEKHSGQSYQRI